MPAQAGRATSARHRFAVWALICSALAARPASAAAPKLQAVGEATLGVSDNISAAPEVPLPDGAERTAGAFLVLRPGAVLAFLSARTLQRLSYTYSYDLYFGEANSNSSSNRLDYLGFFDLSPRVTSVLTAAATQATTYSALTLAPPGSGTLPLLPGGDANTLQLAADEQVNFDLGVGWRAYEGIGILWGTPLFGTDAPKTLAPNARLGLEYALRTDAFGVQGRVEYAVIRNGIQADGTRVPVLKQLVTRGVGTWRRDLGRYFTSSVEAGVMHVDRFDPHRGALYPTGGATLAYADVIGDAQLSYVHAVFTNALLGQSLLTDEVRLRGAVPLDQRERYVVGASAGYQVGRLLDENAELATNVSVLHFDVSFGWRANDFLTLGLRGQHIDQRSDTRIATLPVSYVQNNLMLGAVVRFPPEREMPRGYRAPQRVDRTDELRGTDGSDDRVPAPGGPQP
ncbi:MAG TPA: hypothetical protein VGK73_15165 [Polyangiaceae bacterium]